MANENPKSRQEKQKPDAPQSGDRLPTPEQQPKARAAAAGEGASKVGAPKSGHRSSAKSGQPTKGSNPPVENGSQGDAKSAPARPPATAPRPASLAKPGSSPSTPTTVSPTRPGESPSSSDAGRSGSPQPNQGAGDPSGRPNQQTGGLQGERSGQRYGRGDEEREGDVVFSQRVFDPTATDTVPGRGGRVVGPGSRSGREPERSQRSPGSGLPLRSVSGGPRPPQPRAPSRSPQPSGTHGQPPRPATGGAGQRTRPGGQPHGRPSRGAPRSEGGPPGDSTPRPSGAGVAGPRPTTAAAPVTEIVIPASISVRELAEKMRRSPIDVIKTLMNYGVMVPITQSIDFDTAAIVGEELGIMVKPEHAPEPQAEEIIEEEGPKTLRQKIMAAEKAENLVLRPPVVTVLGHVDHGKTSLLDAIRETRVAAGEAGGITQHIGAYQVERHGKKITFLDTPGHEAFTAMRARGAQVTDIAILVVAADDGVMPQTKEAIAHAKAAGVPIIVALNKMDKSTANPERVKQELADNGLLIEEYGGDVMCVPVSAKFRRNIDDVLEHILLVVEMDPLRANPSGDCVGTVIESRLDKTRGPMATLLVQNGTLHVGDSIVTGETCGKVRAMYDDKGEAITEATPAMPLQILGLEDVPTAGDTFEVIADERAARAIATERQEKRRAAAAQPSGPVLTLEGFFAQAEAGQTKEIALILKADVQGSIEPIASSLEKLSDEKVKVKILHQAAGNITESDVMLAAASNAIIVGFSVNVDGTAQKVAETDGVEIRQYSIIYNIIEDVQKAMKGLLEPVYKETITGHAEVRQVFRITKVGKVAGCYVTEGELARNNPARVKRGGIVVAEDKLASIKRYQEDVPEIKAGFECGINLHNFNDFEVGDVIEAYKKERVS